MKILTFVLCLVLSTAWAQVYTWTDESGQIHFSDVPNNSYDVESVTVDSNSYENVAQSSGDTGYGANHVVMYATSWCPYCRKARQYFRDNGIAFTEYDIEKSAEARRQFDALGARGVPVIFVGDERMNGFSVEEFRKIYQ